MKDSSNTENFIFMLKTYSRDIEYVKRCLGSFEKYNRNDIPLYVVVDEDERDLFKDVVKDQRNVWLICKEDIDTEYTEAPVNGISTGYINQEIVKLSFWKLGICKNYLCIDSELEFIREFYLDEFMYDEEIPYSVLIEDNDLQINPNYYKAFWVERQKQLDKIKQTLGITDRHVMTCHGMQTFNVSVMEDMEEKFVKPNGLSYLKMLEIAPYEFSWYNYYLQKERLIPIHPCEPHFKTYHMPYQQIVDVIQGVNKETLKRAYAGVILNSNYSRDNSGDISEIDDLEWFVIDENARKTLDRILWESRKKSLYRKIKSILRIDE